MSALMRAKMKVSSVTNTETSTQLSLNAVCKSEGYGPDGVDENNTFARWTPSAHCNMVITNPDLVGKFKPGQEFYIDFTLVE